MGQCFCFIFSVMANLGLLKVEQEGIWGGNAFHREHQLRSSASTSSPWERRAQKRWLTKVVLPCGFPTHPVASQPQYLLCSLQTPPSNREHLQHCCGFQRRWLVAQRLFHMLGHIAHSLLQLCREQGKHNLIITAMKSIRSTSATREVLWGEVSALTQPAGSLSPPQALTLLASREVFSRAGEWPGVLQSWKKCPSPSGLEERRGAGQFQGL